SVMWLASCSSQQGDLRAIRASADQALRSGDCAQAVTKLSQIIAADPADLGSRRDRASCYLRLHRLGEAIADYQVIVDADRSSDAEINLATAHWTAGETEAAQSDLRHAASLT